MKTRQTSLIARVWYSVLHSSVLWAEFLTFTGVFFSTYRVPLHCIVVILRLSTENRPKVSTPSLSQYDTQGGLVWCLRSLPNTRTNPLVSRYNKGRGWPDMISLVLSYTCYSVVVLRIEKGCIILMRPRLVPRTNIYSNNRGSGSSWDVIVLFFFPVTRCRHICMCFPDNRT